MKKMAESKFNKVWNILLNYNVEINEDANKDVLCKICKRIMIYPYIGSCGCRYCCRCIKEYIGKERKHCPGDSEECLDEYLKMEINVIKDIHTSRNIANMIIKCPNEICLFRTKLKDMENHIRICAIKYLNETVGCPNERILQNNIKDHQDLGVLKQIQLLVETINNLRNDVSELRQIIILKDREINEMKEKIENNSKQMEDVKKDKKFLLKEIVELKDEIKILKNDEVRLKNQIEISNEKEKILHKELKIMKTIIEDYQRNEDQIKEIDEMKEEMRKLQKDTETKKCDKEIIKNKTREEDEQEIMKTDIKKIKEDLNKEFCINIKEYFDWEIKNFNKKLMNNVGMYFSNFFYKYDYKLCLRAEIAFEWIILSLIIMKGERDDRVRWPMKHTITISVINKESLQNHKYWKRSYYTCKDKSLFRRPVSERNKRIELCSICKREIKDVQGLLKDDSIIVRCLLSLR